MPDANMAQVYNYFSDNGENGYKMATFRDDWKKLTDQDKRDLRTGIGDGTLTY